MLQCLGREGGTMPVSEAKLNANKRYISKFSQVKIYLEPSEKEELQNYCLSTGESMVSFIKRACWEQMKRDGQV